MDETRIIRALMELAILVFSLSLHEFGHAYAATKLGDPTAKLLGRLTLDPRVHADMIGTIIFPLLRFLYPGFIMFGWAKPVPITPENFKHPRRDNAIVATAGPAMNILLALTALTALFILGQTDFFNLPNSSQSVLGGFFRFFFWLNFGLAFFNLIPIYPLDGSWVLKALLPNKLSYQYSRFDRYGVFVFLGVFIFCPSVFNFIFMPVINGLFWVLNSAGLDRLADMINLG
jgi:Zn-dependent protease